jgi:predicted dehydrogenase
MKFLVIGLGSMGKRRIRCLRALGYEHIIGYDPRKDRRNEASEKYYYLQTVDQIKDIKRFDALVISTPPDTHLEYLKLAVEKKIPAFVEASVLSEGLAEINEASKKSKVLIAPSCTMQFHPVIRDIKKIVQSGKYGRVTNFTYHSGNYLPDWHPWEKVTDFYVSNRATGAGREIVPFELTWICDVMGFPTAIKGYFNKTMDVGADIEDSYAFNMKFEKSVGSVIVDVTARYAIRSLVMNLEFGQILWRWDNGYFDLYEVPDKRWIRFFQAEGNAASGYNKNIIEEMYINELATFIKSINNGKVSYPTNLDYDIKILNLLYEIENSDGSFER